MKQDLKNIKVGDKVYSKSNFGFVQIYTVERLLKNYFLANNKKFRYDGFSVGGDSWHRTLVRILDDKAKKEIELIYANQNAKRDVENIKQKIDRLQKSLKLEQAQKISDLSNQIFDILETCEPEKTGAS